MLELAEVAFDPGCAFDRGVHHIRAGLRDRFAGEMTALAPAVSTCLTRASESYPLSAMTATVGHSASNAIALVQSATCQAVIVMASNRPSSPANT